MAARVEIVCVGTELLSGKLNTHMTYFAEVFRQIGLSISRESSVVDSVDEISSAIKGAAERSDVIVVCGGLGPTFDDLSREGVAGALGLKLAFDPELYREIYERYRRFYKKVPEENKRQAFVIEGARVLRNPRGSAPGQMLHHRKKTVVLLPGPYGEMKPMFDGVLAEIKARHAPELEVRKKIFRLCGIAESFADEKLSPLYRQKHPGLDYTILAQPGQVDFHVLASAPTGVKADRLLAQAEKSVRRLVGKYIFGTDEDSLEAVVGTLLRRKGLRLALAESCTGGLLSSLITSVAGSSDYFLGGVIAYANEIKLGQLGVKQATLTKFGAVSAACAKEMAEGLLVQFKADVGLSITGIAGPGGGTKSKPVGLVYISLSRAKYKTRTYEHHFAGPREQVRRRSAGAALTVLYRSLID